MGTKAIQRLVRCRNGHWPGSCSVVGGVISCSLPDIPNSGTVEVRIEVTHLSPESITNPATVSSNTSDPIPGNNSDNHQVTLASFNNTSPTQCVPPPAGLVSWWPGDGNADDIVGTNHSTLAGGATFVPGIVGDAFSFPPSGYVDIGDVLGGRSSGRIGGCSCGWNILRWLSKFGSSAVVFVGLHWPGSGARYR